MPLLKLTEAHSTTISFLFSNGWCHTKFIRHSNGLEIEFITIPDADGVSNCRSVDYVQAQSALMNQ